MSIDKIAQYYLGSAHCEVSEPVHDETIKFLWEEFSQIPCQVVFGDWDDDSSPESLYNSVRSGVLQVSTAFNNPAWCTPSENLCFRAVHDWHHTLDYGDGYQWSTFTLTSELASYNRAVSRYRAYCDREGISFNRQVQALFYSEIVLQASTYFHLGDFPDTQHVVL